MGYSVSVAFKSESERDEMRNFLIQNQATLDKMKKLDYISMSHDNTPVGEDGLSYAPNKKNLLGFNGTGIPRYLWDLCAWMSVKAQCKNTKNHYFYYDSEKMVVTFDTTNTKETVVDAQGIRVDVKPAKGPAQAATLLICQLLSGRVQDIKKQRELFVELDNKWTQLKKTPSSKSANSKKISP